MYICVISSKHVQLPALAGLNGFGVLTNSACVRLRRDSHTVCQLAETVQPSQSQQLYMFGNFSLNICEKIIIFECVLSKCAMILQYLFFVFVGFVFRLWSVEHFLTYNSEMCTFWACFLFVFNMKKHFHGIRLIKRDTIEELSHIFNITYSIESRGCQSF